ncbi:helix-turn-helix domain-containing protein [Nocardia amamiensis]|uniref:helix-turn-helix domain-containing protein n=1 Tax=Nocardia amamiensis TaxID=404578 RepID=UPI000832561B|nr:helix-turn-helix domain-containing protein [Nocardia amamiensis]
MEHTGQRIRYWRRRRGGISQKVLADRAGLTQGYISQIESGQRALDRRATQVAIARALNVTVAQLLGQPGDPTDPAKAVAMAAIPDIRSACVEIAAGERRKPERPREAVREAVDRSTILRNNADYAALAPGMAELLRDAFYFSGPEFVELTFNARFLAKGVGFPDLAAGIADAGLRCARNLELPEWIGLAEISRLNAMPPENAALAARLASRTATEMQPFLGTSRVRQAYGNLLCRGSIANAIAGQSSSAFDLLDEAYAEARSLGETADGGFGLLWFGPTSAAIWHVSVARELGDIDRAIEVARTVDPRPVRAPNRVVYFWTDYGHALTAAGNDSDAVRAFSEAEMVDPQRTRMDPMILDSVSALARRARRLAIDGRLHSLAQSLGIDPHTV